MHKATAAFLVVAIAACSSTVEGTGDGSSSSSGGPGDGGRPGALDAGGDAQPLTCAPLVEEALPPPAITWQGAPACARDGFCTRFPAPAGARPTRIRSAPGGSTWAVSQDTIYSWNETQGRVHSVPVPTDLLSISAVSDSDVWAVGYSSTLAHWDGATWTVSYLSKGSALGGVHARASNDVWTVGNFGVVGHFDGASWTAVNLPGSPSLQDVWAAGPNDVWATEWGTSGALWHYDGSWTKIAIANGAATSFRGIWSAGGGQAWTTTEKGLFRVTRTSIQPVTIPGASGALNAVWGTAADDFWVSDATSTYHFVRGAWTKHAGGASGLTGRSANDVVALGDTHVRKFDGTAWKDVFRVAFPSLTAAWRAPNGDVWFAGAKGAILRARGTEIRSMKTAATGADTIDLRAVWGSSDDDIWFAGNGSTMLHLAGRQVCPVPHPLEPRVRALSGSSKDDIWAIVDGGKAGRWTGASWTVTSLDGAGAIAAFATNDAWATRPRELVHWDGTAWKPAAVPVSMQHTLSNMGTAIGGTGPKDVWTTADVFMEGEKLLRFDGAKWSVTEAPTTTTDAISVLSPTDAWMFDWHVHHWDGNAWTEVSKFPRRDIGAAVATPSAVWMVTSNGAILHRPR